MLKLVIQNGSGMACGSVFSPEGTVVSFRQDAQRKGPRDSAQQDPAVSVTSSFRSREVHEAVLFLQKEHEKVLDGLHKQIQQLQQRYDDLQFEVHLRHMTISTDAALHAQLEELKKQLAEKGDLVARLEGRIEEQNRLLEEERQKAKWKEIQLKQQLKSREDKIDELKAEVARMRDLLQHGFYGKDDTVSSSRKEGEGTEGGGRREGRDPLTPGRTKGFHAENSIHSISRRSSSIPLEVLDASRLKSLDWSRDVQSQPSGPSSPPRPFRGHRKKSKGTTDSSRSVPLSASLCLPISSIMSSLNNSTTSEPERTPRPVSGRSFTLPPISQTQIVTRPQIRSSKRMSSAPTGEKAPQRRHKDSFK